MTAPFDSAHSRLLKAGDDSDDPALQGRAQDPHIAYDVFPETREFQAIICGLIADLAQILDSVGIPPVLPGVNPATGQLSMLNLDGALHMLTAGAFAAGIAAGQSLADEMSVSDDDVAAFLASLEE